MLLIMDERFLPIGSARRPGQGRWPTGDCHRRMPRPNGDDVQSNPAERRDRSAIEPAGQRHQLAGLPEPRGPRNPTLVELDRPSLVPGVHQYADDAISSGRLFQNGLRISAQSALPVGIDHGNPRRAVVDVKPRPHCSPGLLPVNVGSGKAQLAKRNAGPRLRGREGLDNGGPASPGALREPR